MLEVLLASLGSGIAGAAKGYNASFRTANAGRLYLFSSLVSSLGFFEAYRFQQRRKETQGHIPGASSHLMNDTIIESSPTYLVDNLPLFVGIFAAAYTVTGGGAFVVRKRLLTSWIDRFRGNLVRK
jgi:hypothetical protein